MYFNGRIFKTGPQRSGQRHHDGSNDNASTLWLEPMCWGWKRKQIQLVVYYYNIRSLAFRYLCVFCFCFFVLFFPFSSVIYLGRGSCKLRDYKNIYLPFILKCAQEFVLVMFHLLQCVTFSHCQSSLLVHF